MLKCQNWNIRLQILPPNDGPTQGKNIEPHLTTPMTLGSQEALTLLGTSSHKSRIEILIISSRGFVGSSVDINISSISRAKILELLGIIILTDRQHFPFIF